jgi:flagellar biosynthesis chaperone FliJ
MQQHGILVQETDDIRQQLQNAEAQLDFLQKMRKDILEKQLALAPGDDVEQDTYAAQISDLKQGTDQLEESIR